MADWKGREKKPNWRGDAPAPGRKAKHGWKTGEAPLPGNTKRRIAAIIVGAVTVAVAVAFVVIALLPKDPERPCLVLLSANPADHATSLDVPMDLYGWMSANMLADEARQREENDPSKIMKIAPVRRASDLPASEEDLKLWANTLKDEKLNPLVIYVGAHTGTGPEGPFIFGKGHERLPVKRLLETLGGDVLKNKRKVLILDPGRLTPNPMYGQITEDFSRSVKRTLDGEVKKVNNLIVIVGSDEGERAWESEERQATWLALALAEALNSKETSTNGDDIITGLELFKYVKSKTMERTRENRLKASTPFLMPLGEEGESRAQGLEIFVTQPVQAASRGPLPLPEENRANLKSFWEKHDRLRAAGEAAAYSPRLWRRYRELLLRFEAAVRAGEAGTVARLQTALFESEAAFSRRKLPTFESYTGFNSAALRMALGDVAVPRDEIKGDWNSDAPQTPPPLEPGQRLAILNDALRRLSPGGTGTFDAATTLKKLFDQSETRPIEAHLPVMVQHFYAEISKGAEVWKEWFQTIQLRGRIERAALGVDVENTNTPTRYTEKLWANARAKIFELDKGRRTLEDSLFSSERKSDGIAKDMKSWDDELKSIDESSRIFRDQLAKRDRAYADGPYLSEWLLLSGEDDTLFDKLAKEWKEFHDEKAVELLKTLGEIEALVEKASRDPGSSQTQAQWHRLQGLLSIPLLSAASRDAVLKASRETSLHLYDGGGKQTTGSIGSDAIENAPLAVRRARLAQAVLNFDAPTNDIEKLSNAAIGLEQANSMIGSQLERQFQKHAVLPPLVGVVDPVAEKTSRVAVAFESDAHWEPATVNQRLLWSKLLADFGDRTAADRWCDENGKPCYKDIATRYYNDAKSVMESKLPNTFTLTDKQEQALQFEPIKLMGLPAAMVWTSEQHRAVEYRLEVPSVFPVTGYAVAIHDFATIEPLKPMDAQVAKARPLIAVAMNAKPVLAPIVLDIGTADDEHKTVICNATVYFRGARESGKVTIDLQRKAELVLIEPLPKKEKDFSIAVRGSPDLDLGELVIIVDYSGSMKEDLNANELPEGKNFRTEPTKYKLALEALEKVLLKLPKNTRFRIRAFSQKGDEAMKGRLVIGKDEPAIVTWSESDPESLKPHMEIMKGLTPAYLTPLVDSILISAKEDFRNTRDSQTKTILVLTDGSDTSGHEKVPIPNPDQHVQNQRERLQQSLGNARIAVNVVLFALADGAESKRAKTLFADLESFSAKGQVFEAKDGDKLADYLSEALRPRVKVLDGTLTPPGFPVRGMPVKDRSVKSNWSPLIKEPATGYKAIPVPWGGPDEQRLQWSNGDRLYLELAPLDRHMILRRFRASDLREGLPKVTRNNWTLLADHVYTDTQSRVFSLKGIAYLESTPPHLREPKSDRPELTLAFERPRFVWWNIAAKTENAKTETVKVTKLYGYEMPAWEFEVENWPETSASPRAFAPVLLKASVSNSPRTETVEIPFEGIGHSQSPEGEKLEMKTSFEQHPDAAFRNPANRYLVVRVTHAPGRPVYLALAQPLREHNAWHYYYQKAGTSTAVFGPFTEVELKTRVARFMIYSEANVKTESQTLALETPPITATTRTGDGRPVPDNPVTE